MLIRFIVIALITVTATASGQTRPTTQPRGDTLVLSIVIDAPPDEIFECFKTSEGIVKAWGVAQAKNDFRVGGQIRTAYSNETDLDSPKAIVNTILAYVPGRMLAIKPTAPQGAPDWLEAICDAGWSVIALEPLGTQRTRLVITGMGYGPGPLFDKAYSFFEQGNQATLKHMQQVLGHPELKTQADQIWRHLKSQVGGEWVAEKTQPDGTIFRARARWEAALDGVALIGRGSIGDEKALHEHALVTASLDPESGAVCFEHRFEGNHIARGTFVALNDNTVMEPLSIETGPDKPAGAFFAVTRFIDGDKYHFSVYTSEEAARKGDVSNAMVDLEYHRVTGG